MFIKRSVSPSNNVAFKLYFAYCTILTFFIIYQAIIIKPQSQQQEEEALWNKSHVVDNGTSMIELTVCGRNLSASFDYHDHTNKKLKEQKRPSWSSKKRLVVIGHDKMNHVQLNNKLNAIFHATDYANDINADIAIIRQGWPTQALKMLFRSTTFQNDNDRVNNQLSWESEITKNLNIKFLDKEEILRHEVTQLYEEVAYLAADDMYYYHTKASVDTIKERRESILRFLWSHPTRNSHASKDVCSVVNHVDESNQKGYFTSFSVVHVRWMKKNGCLNRMGGLAHHFKNMTGMSMDRKAPCLLDPSYIQSIVSQCGMEDKPIFVITDGMNETIISNLQKDDKIGGQIRLPPKNVSWVGGDMMLGVLSDCFIGTPISTLSGNIARARIALGKDPATNFLFPMKRRRRTDAWEFLCQEKGEDCLYDVRALNHYVG